MGRHVVQRTPRQKALGAAAAVLVVLGATGTWVWAAWSAATGEPGTVAAATLATVLGLVPPHRARHRRPKAAAPARRLSVQPAR